MKRQRHTKKHAIIDDYYLTKTKTNCQQLNKLTRNSYNQFHPVIEQQSNQLKSNKFPLKLTELSDSVNGELKASKNNKRLMEIKSNFANKMNENKQNKQSIKQINSKIQTKAAPNLSRRIIGANWQEFLQKQNENVDNCHEIDVNVHQRTVNQLKTINNNNHVTCSTVTKCLSMDCEMVGIGFTGKQHMLARVSIVNQYGRIILDKYVKPMEPVTDYRTKVSGIRPKDIENGEEFHIVQKCVADLLKNRILIGHAVYNDLKVLFLSHPNRDIRDTSKYKPFSKMVTGSSGGGATPSLKTLARLLLGYNIQEGEHNSVEDARAAMQIYKKYCQDWESMIRKRKSSKYDL